MTTWSSSPKRKKARALLRATLPAVCPKCGQWITAEQEWDVGHRTPLLFDPASMDDPENWQAEHSTCNRREGQWLSSQRRRRPRRPISPTSRDW